MPAMIVRLAVHHDLPSDVDEVVCEARDRLEGRVGGGGGEQQPPSFGERGGVARLERLHGQRRGARQPVLCPQQRLIVRDAGPSTAATVRAQADRCCTHL